MQTSSRRWKGKGFRAAIMCYLKYPVFNEKNHELCKEAVKYDS